MNYKVQIIAPSSGVTDGNVLAIQFASLLTKRGFIVKPPKDLCIDLHFYANTAEKRLEQLQEALLDPEVDIIWALRGGYGSAEIASQCLNIKPSHPKIFIGYSDCTVLHELFHEQYKMPSIHGSVGSSLLGAQAKHIDDMLAILAGNEVKINLAPVTSKAENLHLKSSLTGGNMAMLTTLIGTPLHPVTKGKILLLEDVGEKGYKVRRMFNHLSQAGILADIEAIILGDFIQSDEHLEFAFEDFFARNPHIPVFRAKGIGHGETNIPIILGSYAEIENGILKIASPFSSR